MRRGQFAHDAIPALETHSVRDSIRVWIAIGKIVDVGKTPGTDTAHSISFTVDKQGPTVVSTRPVHAEFMVVSFARGSTPNKALVRRD